MVVLPLIGIGLGIYLADQLFVFGETPLLMTATTHPMQYYLSLKFAY